MSDESSSGSVVVIAGPSGSGKNSVLEGILEACGNCTRLVTATTREPREGEEHGKDYYFFSKEVFLEGVKDGTIPEHWHAPETDRYYGTYLPDLERKLRDGNVVLAHMQIEGMRYFKAHHNALTLFIVPDSIEELARRVEGRQKMNDRELQERLAEAQHEVTEHAPHYDHTIINARDKLPEAIEQALTILREEHVIQ